MNALDFLVDLETKPRWLNLLADRFAVANPFATVPRDVDRVLLLGMGSSRYAALGACSRLRSRGIDAAVEYASASAPTPPTTDQFVVAVSAIAAGVLVVPLLGMALLFEPVTVLITGGVVVTGVVIVAVGLLVTRPLLRRVATAHVATA